jgi:hypothetical protein
MKGTIWAFFATAIGLAVFLMAAVPAAAPSSPASSTDAVANVLQVTSPFVGLVFTVAVIGVLLTYAFKV